MMLARSPWPRSGGDQANRSAAAVPGPHVMPRFRHVPLPSSATPSDHADVSGVVVATDGSLRACHRGVLSALTRTGTVLWQVDLAGTRRPSDPLWHGLPTALDDNQTLVPLPYALTLVAADGRIDNTVGCEDILDDSGLPPNITSSGWPIVASLLGSVYLLRDGQWVAIGDGGYGYDIVCPALYDDDTLAIAGYCGTGFCRVALDGTIRWQSRLREADLVPTVNRRQVAAVGSLNEGVSAFFAPDGTQVGHYAQAAVFAAYGDDWVALSKTRLARLSPEGAELWGQDVPMQRVRGRIVQPVVDAEGYIYVRHDEGLRCCDAEGRCVFEVTLPSTRPDPLSIIAPGAIALVSEDELLIGEA